MKIKGDESFPPQTTTNEEPTHPRDAWAAEWGGLTEAAEMTGLPIEELMSEDPVGETRVPTWVDDLDAPHDPTITAEPGEPNPEAGKGFTPPTAPALPRMAMFEDLEWGDPDPLDDSGALEAMAWNDVELTPEEVEEMDAGEADREEEDVRPITQRLESLSGDISTIFHEMAAGLGIDVGVKDPIESRIAHLDRILQAIEDFNQQREAVVPTAALPSAHDDTDVCKDNVALDPGVYNAALTWDATDSMDKKGRCMDTAPCHLDSRFESAPPK